MTDLSLLRSFLEVAECGTITTAARRLFVTQPALSRRLQLLESELDAELFERTRQGMNLTEEGRIVQAHGLDLVERWERMQRAVSAASNMDEGTVRIGGGATAVAFLLPEAIAEFQRKRPQVLFQVKEAGSRDVERDVLEERLELGIVTLPTSTAEFDVRPLQTDRIVLVAAPGHPLAAKARIPVSALQGQDLVGFESPSAIRSLIDGALKEKGVQVHVVMELRSIPAILRMVQATDCLAFVSQLGVGEGSGGVHILPVTGLKIERRLAIIRKKDRPLSPAAAEFVQLLRRAR
ncbi:MAG: LysR family transcriptional regulator [Planctomycetes bacterium]|nr:LysR family transcriptional regulator [Planctomycetota bacterium]